MTDLLSTIALRKQFNKHTVLNGIDFSLAAGQVIGLLGRNGAGKSTLIRCALGLSPIDAGSALIFDTPAESLSRTQLARVGYVPQTFDLFPWMKVRIYLDLMASFYPRWDHALVARLLGSWAIDARQRIGELSQGQRQKLAIMRALAHDPDLLILDEPVASLDPHARRDFMHELLSIARKNGKAILFSTHITSDLERADADIALLKDGKIMFVQTLFELRARVRRVRLDRETSFTDTLPFPAALSQKLIAGSLELIVDTADDQALHTLASAAGATLMIQPMTLEDIFVELG